MKKGNKVEESKADYNRSDLGPIVRGKYAERMAKESNIIVLDPDVFMAFPNDKAVNTALRGLLQTAEKTAKTAPRKAARARRKI